MSQSQPDPVKHAHETPELRRTLEQACAMRGLSGADARLIHRYSNAVYHLPVEDAVARITTGSLHRAELAHQVTAWLAEYNEVAATTPIADAPPVRTDDGSVVGFWTYYPQPNGRPEPASAHLARILRRLHYVDEVPYSLEAWQPLTSLLTALADPAVAGNLTPCDRGWLVAHVSEVEGQVQALDSPLGQGIIHGDAWAGNVLWHPAAGPDATVIGDWDWTSYGPREVDLIPTWHAAIRYGRGPGWAADFSAVYGYDLERWDGFSVLFAMRDLVQLTGPLRRAADRPEFAAALQERLMGIREQDRHAVWRAL